MRTLDDLARLAYAARFAETPTRNVVPFDQLPAGARACWERVAGAVLQEMLAAIQEEEATRVDDPKQD